MGEQLIAIIDDREETLELYRRMIKKEMPSINIAMFNKPSDVLNWKNIKDVDLFIVDIILPEKDGLSLCNELFGICGSVPFLIVSGIEPSVDYLKNLFCFYELIKKPIESDLFIERIRVLLNLSRHNRWIVRSLEENMEKFRALTEASQDGIYIHNMGKLIEANSAFFDMLGYGRDDFETGVDLSKLIYKDDLNKLEKIFERIRNDPNYEGFYELRYNKKDGSIIPVRGFGKPTRYLGINARVVTIRDLTIEIRETTLRETLWNLINSSGVFVLVLDKNSKIILCNNPIAEKLGYENENNLIDLNWVDNFIPDHEKDLIKNIHNEIIEGKIKSYSEYTNDIISKDNKIITVKWFNDRIVNGQPITLSIGYEISEDKKEFEKTENIKNIWQNKIFSDRRWITDHKRGIK